MNAEGSRTSKSFFPFRRRCTLRPHSAAVNFLDFSRDGEFLLAASSDKTISLSAPLLGRHIASYGGSGHQAVVTCVSSGFGNASFLSTAADGRAFLWDVETQQVLRTFPRQKGQLKTCLLLDAADSAPRPAGGPAAGTGGHNSSLRLTQGQQQQQRSSVCSDTRISQVAVIAGEDRAVRFFDIRQRNRQLACLDQLHDAKDSITCLLFTGSSFLASSADGCVYEYDVRKGRMHVDEIGQPVSSISLSTEGESLLLGCADGYLRLQERASGEVLLALAGHASKLQHYRLDAHFTLIDMRRKDSSLSLLSSASLPLQQQQQQLLPTPLFPNRGRRRIKRTRQHAEAEQQQTLLLQQEDEGSLLSAEDGQEEQEKETAVLPFESAARDALKGGAPEGSSADFEQQQQQHAMEEEEAASHASTGVVDTGEAARIVSSVSEDTDISDDYFSSSADEEEGPPVYRLCVVSGSEDGSLVGWDLQTAAAAAAQPEEQHQQKKKKQGSMIIRRRVHGSNNTNATAAAASARCTRRAAPAPAREDTSAAAARSFAAVSQRALQQQQREPLVALLSLRLQESQGLLVTGASDGVIKVWKKR